MMMNLGGLCRTLRDFASLALVDSGLLGLLGLTGWIGGNEFRSASIEMSIKLPPSPHTTIRHYLQLQICAHCVSHNGGTPANGALLFGP